MTSTHDTPIVRYSGNPQDLPPYFNDLHTFASNHNVMALLVGDVNFHLMYPLNNADGDGHEPHRALIKPTLAADATSDAIARYNIFMKEYNSEQDNLMRVRTALIASIDEATKLSLSSPVDGLARVSMPTIYAKLKELSALTSSDIDYYTKMMEAPYVDDGVATLRAYLSANHERAHTFLENANMPVYAHQKIQNVEKALAGIPRFTLAISTYKLEFSTPALKTYANFVDKLMVADREFPREQTSGGTAMANAAQASRASTDAQRIKKLEAEIAQLKVRGGGGSGTKAGVGNDGTVFTQYCWTHGPSTTHCSANCKNQADGHNTGATMKDKKGGRAEPWGK